LGDKRCRISNKDCRPLTDASLNNRRDND